MSCWRWGWEGDTCTLHPSDQPQRAGNTHEASEACEVSASVCNVSGWRYECLFVEKVFGNVRVVSGDAVAAAVM